jgi:hypothetical protein
LSPTLPLSLKLLLFLALALEMLVPALTVMLTFMRRIIADVVKHASMQKMKKTSLERPKLSRVGCDCSSIALEKYLKNTLKKKTSPLQGVREIQSSVLMPESEQGCRDTGIFIPDLYPCA